MSITYERIVGRMTGPGGPFELVEETVGGRPMRNFLNWAHSIRELLQTAGARGDAAALVYGARRYGYAEFTELCYGVGHRLADDYGLARAHRHRPSTKTILS